VSDDGPNYSRHGENRQVTMTVVCVFSFFVTLATTCVGMKNLIGGRTHFESGVETFLIVFTAVLSALLAAALAGVFADRIHRSIWPERIGEE